MPELELRKVILNFELSGKRVILTNDVPSASTGNPSDCKASRFIFDQRECKFAVYEFDSVGHTNEALARALSGTNAVLIDTYSLICPLQKPVCSSSFVDENEYETLIYRDLNHLNLEGSKLVGGRLAEVTNQSPQN